MIRLNLIACSLASSLVLLPSLAMAASPQCVHSEPRDLKLDLAGAKAVVFEVNSHDLVLQAAANAPAELNGRACASNPDWLKQLTVTQQKVGDKLIVKLEREKQFNGISLGSTYAYLDVRGSVPDTILVQLKVGSGDAEVSGAHSLSADVGSGDVKLRGIKGQLTAAVGSGDLEFDGSGPLHVVSIGSGDIKGRNVGGAAKIGQIGSGELTLEGVRGPFSLAALGSGDVDVRSITGDASVDLIGSGTVELRGVTGNVRIGTVGSGDVGIRDVTGNLTVERSGSGSIKHDQIRGTTQLPRKR